MRCAVTVLLVAAGAGTALGATPAQFKSQASAICVTFHERAFAISIAHNPTEAANAARESVALGEQFIKALRALDTPAADAAGMKLVLTYVAREDGTAAAAVSKADPAAYSALAAKGHAWDAKARAVFRQLGLQGCAAHGLTY